ncbi:hypothetical protein BSF38_03214 [Paludisphaera borealis]|uniref:Uncharacterized protein n=1 Tax=Paludisphaera borealis TaxID=1387353 RepID=A0A1U7CRW5_9BACT|nr:hypothetical protein BSF38_03214 [Paludisphaera borealis]
MRPAGSNSTPGDAHGFATNEANFGERAGGLGMRGGGQENDDFPRERSQYGFQAEVT